MPRWRLREADFLEFLETRRRAASAGGIVEPDQSDSWASFIQTRGFDESMAMAIARQRMESVSAVIINEGREGDGLYLFSDAEEICLRVVEIS